MQIKESRPSFYTFAAMQERFFFEALHTTRSPLLSRITGYIFDCGPVDITAKAIRTATQQVLGDYVADIVLRGFHALLPSDEFEKRRTEFASIFSSGSSSTRKLFLYSTADKIADSRFIENVVHVDGVAGSLGDRHETVRPSSSSDELLEEVSISRVKLTLIFQSYPVDYSNSRTLSFRDIA
jgi:hypothetical protein